MKHLKHGAVLVLILLMAIVLAGCYWNEDLSSNQMGVKMDGGQITGCVGPGGVYSDGGWFAELKPVSLTAVKLTVEDPEVATSDNQLVGVAITVQAARKSDCDSLKNLMTNWTSLTDDALLSDTIASTTKESIKNGVRGFSLTQLLDDRNKLATSIMESLEQDAEKYGVQIINVTIENIALQADYAKVLSDKALITAQLEQAVRQQDLINQQAANNQLEQQTRAKTLEEQLKAEEAQTAVDVEIASREGKKIAAANQVYLDNAPAFELRRLELISTILGDKSTVYFMPAGTDLSMWFTPYGPASPTPAVTQP